MSAPQKRTLLFDFNPKPNETTKLRATANEQVNVKLVSKDGVWSYCINAQGREGYVPTNYLAPLHPPSIPPPPPPPPPTAEQSKPIEPEKLKFLQHPITRCVMYSDVPLYSPGCIVTVMAEPSSTGWVLCLSGDKQVFIPAAHLATDKEMIHYYSSLRFPPPPTQKAPTTRGKTCPVESDRNRVNPVPKPVRHYPAKAISIFSFASDSPNTVSILHGEEVTVTEPEKEKWIHILKEDGTQGYVPSSHIQIL